jgi:hypothetical protein
MWTHFTFRLIIVDSSDATGSRHITEGNNKPNQQPRRKRIPQFPNASGHLRFQTNWYFSLILKFSVLWRRVVLSVMDVEVSEELASRWYKNCQHPEYKGSSFICNVGSSLAKYMRFYPRRTQSKSWVMWEPQNSSIRLSFCTNKWLIRSQ